MKNLTRLPAKAKPDGKQTSKPLAYSIEGRTVIQLCVNRPYDIIVNVFVLNSGIDIMV